MAQATKHRIVRGWLRRAFSAATMPVASRGIAWGGLLSLAALAVVAGILLMPSFSAAQSDLTTLVSNTGQGNRGVGDTGDRISIQFTTGSNPAGYRIASVAVMVAADETDRFTASVVNVDMGEPDPTDVEITLTAPSTYSGGLTTFTAPADARLAASTTYAVSVIGVANAQVRYANTSSSGEDSGGATGWSIANGSNFGTTVLMSALVIEIEGVVLNNEPTFDDNSPVTYTVNENVAGASIGTPSATDGDGDSLTYTLGTGAPTGLQINSTTGALSLPSGTSLDHEVDDSYMFVVSVRDSLDDERDAETDPGPDDTIAVILNVTDVDETETLAVSPSPPKAGTASTATLTEGDEYTVDSWQWARGDSRTGSFTDITSATSATYTPTADDIGKYLRVSVQYDHSNATFGEDVVLRFVTAEVLPGNTDPSFGAVSTSRSVPEHNLATNIGAAVMATDPTRGTPLSTHSRGRTAPRSRSTRPTGRSSTLPASTSRTRQTWAVPSGITSTS